MMSGGFGTIGRHKGGFGTSNGRPLRQSEPVVPMINVVFLLLIFFLMTAEIAPPEPFDLTLPQSTGGDSPASGAALFLSARGEIAFGKLRGPEAIAAAANAATTDPDSPPRPLRVDANAPATALAALLADLARAGVTDVVLLTRETPHREARE
jgi:biopolymer transport protein ExbD